MTTTVVAGATIVIPEFTSSTNLGSMTKPAVLPTDCLEDLYDMGTKGLGLPWTYETQGCAVSTCCPSEKIYTEDWAWMTTYWSPGLCPSQYRQCHGPPSPTALSLDHGETVAFCCPTNYDCPNTTIGGVFAACQSALSTDTPVTVLDNIFHQSVISTRRFTLPSTLAYSYQVAYPIQVRWRSGDFDGKSSPPQNTEASNGSSNSDKSDKNNDSGGGNHNDLSTGTIVGIVIGSLAFVALAAFLVIGTIVLARRRRRDAPLAASAQQPQQRIPPSDQPENNRWDGNASKVVNTQSMQQQQQHHPSVLQEIWHGNHKNRMPELGDTRIPGTELPANGH